MNFQPLEKDDFEQVVFCQDQKTGLKAVIAIHSTALGPAVGGCRMWKYSTDEEGIFDALRLSKGMTYKAAISGLNWGGGKAVILEGPKGKTRDLLLRYGEYVNRLGGHYVTAKDVGIGSDDLKTVKEKTPHVLGIDGVAGSSGDPSPATGFGVYQGIKASAEFAFGSDQLKGKRIAVQGLGSVAFYMMEHLHKEGAILIGCDINEQMKKRAQDHFKLEIVAPEKIFDVDCDIFSPCALGGALTQETVSRLKAKVIAGGANNQLATPDMAEVVTQKGFVYAPDYAINAGGLINIYHESSYYNGYDRARAFDHVAKIRQTITSILKRSKEEKLPTAVIADRMAEERFKAAKK